MDDHINGNEVWDAVIDGTYTFTGTKHYDPAEKRDIDIHVIYHSSGNKLQTNVGMARAIEAHRKVDMVVAMPSSLPRPPATPTSSCPSPPSGSASTACSAARSAISRTAR